MEAASAPAVGANPPTTSVTYRPFFLSSFLSSLSSGPLCARWPPTVDVPATGMAHGTRRGPRAPFTSTTSVSWRLVAANQQGMSRASGF